MTNKSIQLVLPMAGKGSRFADAGYKLSKPMLPIGSHPMFLNVLANTFDERIYSITIIKQRSVSIDFDSSILSSRLGIKFNLVELDAFTDGAATTVELGLKTLIPNLPVVIVNSDQYVNGNLTHFYDAVVSKDYDGVILAMNDDDPKWSYIQIDGDNKVCKVVEKEVVSDLATVGIYGFSSALVCQKSIENMKDEEFTVNNEYYLAPAYNYLPRGSKPIHFINLGPVGDVMFGLGIPKDYEDFLSSPIVNKAISATENLFGKYT